MFNPNVETLPLTYSIKGYKKKQISLLTKIGLFTLAFIVLPSVCLITFFIFRIS